MQSLYARLRNLAELDTTVVISEVGPSGFEPICGLRGNDGAGGAEGIGGSSIDADVGASGSAGESGMDGEAIATKVL